MTTTKQLPEEATIPPRVLTPDEEAERARRAVEQSLALEADAEGDPLDLADPDNPLRMPGEMSTRPRAAGRQGAGASKPHP